MNNAQNLVTAEQNMQNILEENQDELDEFLNDNNINHNAAKAYICFALAAHYALRAMENEGYKPDKEIKP